MPVSTPNLIADPVTLERYDPPGIIRLSNEIVVSYYNTTGTTILQGEPVFVAGRVGLAVRCILPGTIGSVAMDWVADLILDTALAASILQYDTVWWSYDVSPIVAGVGGAVRAAPTNGFIIGLAVATPGVIRLNGSSKYIAAAVGDTRVRVMSNYEPAVAIGTIPTFN